MKKRIICLLLAVITIFSLMPTAFAASSEATAAADTLHSLGLFNGTGTDANGNPIYDLDRAPTRHEAVTMLVRILGKGVFCQVKIPGIAKAKSLVLPREFPGNCQIKSLVLPRYFTRMRALRRR